MNAPTRSEKLSSVGAAADMANLPAEFSTPDNNAARAMKERYGIVICVSRIASGK